ncbi:Gfo/Idh/MocA family protein [Halapricum salinum]|uniref:Gfo/Idh/MocA family oxidoreductase n=1 Tax=Halapricum salinum TaxID=1457250 RepID=A0A4D6H8B1_9EURY|nr:Gfo/Idh/MocA family oxidoreductase [Halapricum salinum]QCC49865.1 gfo/Idh/MocA family oxidoreductase [Halapricum salinum]
MAQRVIHVGCGGWGAMWVGEFLPANVEDDTIEVVAAVDQDPEALENANRDLDLPDERCYTDAETAFESHDAEFATLVVPPEVRKPLVEAALAHDLDLLTEKPIAPTLAEAVEIADIVEQAGARMAVTMSHRFDRDKTTLRRRIQRGEYGPLDYLVFRFTQRYRQRDEWVAGRPYEMDHPLLVEGGVHHLDLLASLAGAKCERLYARTWNPEWSDFSGDSQALVTMEFENGVHATYEGATTNAVSMNGWNNEYVRAECRDATLELDARELTAYPYDPDAEPRHTASGPPEGETIPLDDREKWMNSWLIEQFCQWRAGGEPMPTRVSENLQSVALIEAAMRSSERDEPVAVQELLEHVRRE